MKKSKSGLNKSAFVRSLPLELSADEVVKKAKTEGLELTPKHVYVIRALAKKKAATATGKPATNGATPKAAPVRRGRRPYAKPAVDVIDTDTAFKAIVRDIGVRHAQALLDAFKAA